MRRTIAIVTVTCFSVTSVFGQLLQAAHAVKQESAAPRDTVIPQSLGRVTSRKLFGGAQIVVHIQDLHCHPEVQRNISGILSALDRDYGLEHVYVEGAHGTVDTSWLAGVGDEGESWKVMERLVDEGRLTGSEHYSARSGRYDVLQGIEDAQVHKTNIVRLGRILDGRNEMELRLAELDKDLAFMQAKFLGPWNRKLSRAAERYRRGELSAERYYETLIRYSRAANKHYDRFARIDTISIGNYPSLTAFVELGKLKGGLRAKKASRELTKLMQLLRSRAAYGAYRSLVEQGGDVDAFYSTLATLAREHHIELAAGYPELGRYMEYTRKSRELNPAALPDEERRLHNELLAGFSKDIAELEVAFLVDFHPKFRDYLLNRLNADDYEYVSARLERFTRLWGKYAFRNRVAEFAEDLALLDEFYRTNVRRNECFLRNITALDRRAAVPASDAAQHVRSLSQQLRDSRIIVLVAGGFHTKGLSELLEKQRISHLVITPSASKDAVDAASLYREFALLQAEMLTNALALEFLSQMSPAVAVQGNTARITFGNGKSMLLEKTGDKLSTRIIDGAKDLLHPRLPGFSDMAGPAARRAVMSFAGTLKVLSDFTGFAGAVPETYAVFVSLLYLAAERSLITGEGLIPELVNGLTENKRIEGMNLEIIARLPEELQRMIRLRLNDKEELERIAERDPALRVLLTVRSLLNLSYITGGSAASPVEYESPLSASIQASPESAYRGFLKRFFSAAGLDYAAFETAHRRTPDGRFQVKEIPAGPLTFNGISSISSQLRGYGDTFEVLCDEQWLPVAIVSEKGYILVNPGFTAFVQLLDGRSGVTAEVVERIDRETTRTRRLVEDYAAFRQIDSDAQPLYGQTFNLVLFDLEQNALRSFSIDSLPEIREELSHEGERHPVRALMPVLPTVYSQNHQNNVWFDKEYYTEVLRRIKPGDKVLVVGPGAGTDTLAAHLRSRTDIYVTGINPLEVLNTELTALTNGFAVHGRVHDNIVTPEGNPVFPGVKFDWILWNMPEYTGSDEPASVNDYTTNRWDGDYDGETLRRFARSLSSLLSERGKALIWNTDDPEVAEIIMQESRIIPQALFMSNSKAVYLLDPAMTMDAELYEDLEEVVSAIQARFPDFNAPVGLPELITVLRDNRPVYFSGRSPDGSRVVFRIVRHGSVLTITYQQGFGYLERCDDDREAGVKLDIPDRLVRKFASLMQSTADRRQDEGRGEDNSPLPGPANTAPEAGQRKGLSGPASAIDSRTASRGALVDSLRTYLDILLERRTSDSRLPDVFLVLGHYEIRAFVDFARKWRSIAEREGVLVPVVLSGGRGSGTIALIERAHQWYNGSLAGHERAWLASALQTESIKETDIMRFILNREGIPDDCMFAEQEPSLSTGDNLVKSRGTIAGLVLNKTAPLISIVSYPTLRASLNAAYEWSRHPDSRDWKPVIFNEYEFDVAELSDTELIRLAGDTAGYPARFVRQFPLLNRHNELRGTRERYSDIVPPYPLVPDAWDALRVVKRDFKRFLEARGDIFVYDEESNALVVRSPDESTKVDLPWNVRMLEGEVQNERVRSIYHELDLPKNAEDSAIEIEESIDNIIPLEIMSGVLQGTARVELHLGLQEHTERYLRAHQAQGYTVSDFPIKFKRKKELWHRVAKGNDTIYVLDRIYGDSRLYNAVAMFKYKNIPPSRIAIRDFYVNYREEYHKALSGFAGKIDRAVFSFDVEKRVQDILSSSEGSEILARVEERGLYVIFIRLSDGKTLAVIDIETNGYGSHISTTLDYLTDAPKNGGLGVNDIIFLGNCGALDRTLKLNDIIMYRNAYDWNMERVDTPVNRIDTERLSELLRGADIAIHERDGATVRSIFCEKTSDIESWRRNNIGFIEMELPHISGFFDREGRERPVRFQAIVKVTDIVGGKHEDRLKLAVTIPSDKEKSKYDRFNDAVVRYILANPIITQSPIVNLFDVFWDMDAGTKNEDILDLPLIPDEELRKDFDISDVLLSALKLHNVTAVRSRISTHVDHVTHNGNIYLLIPPHGLRQDVYHEAWTILDPVNQHARNPFGNPMVFDERYQEFLVNKGVRVLEIHPTNRCNLRCTGCTYQAIGRQETLPIEALTKWLPLLNPSSVKLVGGGEPTFYRHKNYDFNDFILLIRELLPNVEIGLITNGFTVPKGRWVDELSWISVSMHGVSQESYAKNTGIKTPGAFEHVLDNVFARYYLESGIKVVRSTYLLSNYYFDDIFALTRAFFLKWAKTVEKDPDIVHRKSFSMFLQPMADDSPGSLSSPFKPAIIDQERTEQWAKQIERIKDNEPEFYEFLSKYFPQLSGLNLSYPDVKGIEKCFVASDFMILAASGVFFPCFVMTANYPENRYGTWRDAPEEIYRRRLEAFKNGVMDRCKVACRPFYQGTAKYVCDHLQERILSLASLAGSSKGDKPALILPRNRPLVETWLSKGQPVWRIALKVAFQERFYSFVMPGAFVDEHAFSEQETVSVNRTLRILNYAPVALGFSAAAGLALHGAVAAAVATMATGIATGILMGGLYHWIRDMNALRNDVLDGSGPSSNPEWLSWEQAQELPIIEALKHVAYAKRYNNRFVPDQLQHTGLVVRGARALMRGMDEDYLDLFNMTREGRSLQPSEIKRHPLFRKFKNTMAALHYAVRSHLDDEEELLRIAALLPMVHDIGKTVQAVRHGPAGAELIDEEVFSHPLLKERLSQKAKDILRFLVYHHSYPGEIYLDAYQVYDDRGDLSKTVQYIDSLFSGMRELTERYPGLTDRQLLSLLIQNLVGDVTSFDSITVQQYITQFSRMLEYLNDPRELEGETERIMQSARLESSGFDLSGSENPEWLPWEAVREFPAMKALEEVPYTYPHEYARNQLDHAELVVKGVRAQLRGEEEDYRYLFSTLKDGRGLNEEEIRNHPRYPGFRETAAALNAAINATLGDDTGNRRIAMLFAMIHDIGKSKIMKSHGVAGAEIIDEVFERPELRGLLSQKDRDILTFLVRTHVWLGEIYMRAASPGRIADVSLTSAVGYHDTMTREMRQLTGKYPEVTDKLLLSLLTLNLVGDVSSLYTLSAEKFEPQFRKMLEYMNDIRVFNKEKDAIVIGKQKKQDVTSDVSVRHHISGRQDILDEVAEYSAGSGSLHLLYTFMPDADDRASLSQIGFNVSVSGAAKPARVWTGVRQGVPVFYMDLKGAGVPGSAYDQALREGAAQIIAALSGTDTLQATAATVKKVRERWGSADVNKAGKAVFEQVVVIDHTRDTARTKRAFSDGRINKALIVRQEELEGKPATDIDGIMKKMLTRRAAVSATMGENKILKMDTSDLDEFREMLGLFNAAGNGQMLVDWLVFAQALEDKRISVTKVRELLTNAKQHGVLVHCSYRADNDTDTRDIERLYDLGFQGLNLDLTRLDTVRGQRLLDAAAEYPLLAVDVPEGIESPAPLRKVKLSEVREDTRFSPTDVLDIEIPEGMTLQELRDHFARLPLINTMIFHSKDVREIIGATRDIIDKSAFASILRILLNFGRVSIDTPEKARRLANNWAEDEIPGLRPGEAGIRQITALLEGSMSNTDISPYNALYEQVQELAAQPELRKAFLAAIAERILIKAHLRQYNPELGESYAKGTCHFSTPLQQEILGTALLRRFLMTPQEASLDIEAAQALKDGVSENAQSFLHRRFTAIRTGTADPGSLTAVIDIILMDLVFDFRLRKDFMEKRGTLDLRTVNRILQAA